MPESVKQGFTLRRPSLDDAAWIWRLVRETGVLDENSSYAYLLLCRDFAETCLVAERDSQLVGFVTAYRPPSRTDVLFVWQIGVSSMARRQGLGLLMLTELVSRCRCEGGYGVSFVEATVTRSNQASQRLFASLAKRLQARLVHGEGFRQTHFRFGHHEAEPLIQIGPIADG
ncbi:MAG: diaminobutyrate acetyltransferase [Planctomycetaceae bacterium]|jgi:L-2,4-diaminobutyric acid acetyltransferase|nr:diaminobutyrate acetyltransferase [Planctomycetaceae bacterium]